MVRWMVRRGAARVADQTWDVDFYEGEVVEIETPCPDACGCWLALIRTRDGKDSSS
jgi:hypothetical protein